MDFSLSPDTETGRACISLHVNTFREVCTFVASLPYARNTNRSDIFCVLNERRGTCSTKHRFLKSVADAHGFGEKITLHVGIFLMCAENTPNVADVLQKNALTGIPEAHCYVRADGELMDFTYAHARIDFMPYLMEEHTAVADTLHHAKAQWHIDCMARWAEERKLPHTTAQLWEVREQCIAQLSKVNARS